MAQSSNQFLQTPEKGQLTLMQNLNVLSCKVKTAEATPLVPGQSVKLVDIAGSIIVVTAAAAGDDIFGFIPFNIKKSSYAADEMVKVALRDCVMIMEAGAALASGAYLEIVASGQKVITNAGSNTIVAKSLTKAAAGGDLIVVWILTMSVNQPMTFLELTDTPAAYSASDTLKVNSGADAVEFVTI